MVGTESICCASRMIPIRVIYYLVVGTENFSRTVEKLQIFLFFYAIYFGSGCATTNVGLLPFKDTTIFLQSRNGMKCLFVKLFAFTLNNSSNVKIFIGRELVDYIL